MEPVLLKCKHSISNMCQCTVQNCLMGLKEEENEGQYIHIWLQNVDRDTAVGVAIRQGFLFESLSQLLVPAVRAASLSETISFIWQAPPGGLVSNICSPYYSNDHCQSWWISVCIIDLKIWEGDRLSQHASLKEQFGFMGKPIMDVNQDKMSISSIFSGWPQ